MLLYRSAWFQRLKLRHDHLPSNLGFNFNLRHYHLADALTVYVCHQIDCGAQVVQLFDSWAGTYTPPLLTST